MYTVSARKIKTLQISEMVLSKPQIWYLPSWDVVFDITKAIFKYRSVVFFFLTTAFVTSALRWYAVRSQLAILSVIFAHCTQIQQASGFPC